MTENVFALQAEAEKARVAALQRRNSPARPSGVEGVFSSAAQGVFLGAGDEINAALSVALGARRNPDGTYSYLNYDRSIADAYQEELAANRRVNDQFREDRPGLAITSEIGGALLVPGGAVRAAGGSGAAGAARSAAAAGAGGAVYGFNAGESGLLSRLRNSAMTGALAAPFGAVAPSVGGLIERAVNRVNTNRAVKQAVRAAPSQEQLRQQASDIFQRADTRSLPTDSLPDAVQGILGNIGSRPMNPRLVPRSAAVMDELTDIATNPSERAMFGELQDVRRMTEVARRDFTNPAEQRAGALIAEGIDEFVDSVDPKLGKEIGEARDMWSRLRRSQQIEEAIEKASNQASGFENGLRVQIRAILNNKKRRAGFSKAEIDAMEQIVQGTRFGNLMKRLGKLGFGQGQQTNVLSGTAGMGTAGVLGTLLSGGNPVVGAAAAAVPPIIGTGARAISEAGTARAARNLQGLAASQPLNPQLVTPAQRGLLDALAARSGRSVEALGFPDMLEGLMQASNQ